MSGCRRGAEALAPLSLFFARKLGAERKKLPESCSTEISWRSRRSPQLGPQSFPRGGAWSIVISGLYWSFWWARFHVPPSLERKLGDRIFSFGERGPLTSSKKYLKGHVWCGGPRAFLAKSSANFWRPVPPVPPVSSDRRGSVACCGKAGSKNARTGQVGINILQ